MFLSSNEDISLQSDLEHFLGQLNSWAICFYLTGCYVRVCKKSELQAVLLLLFCNVLKKFSFSANALKYLGPASSFLNKRQAGN